MKKPLFILIVILFGNYYPLRSQILLKDNSFDNLAKETVFVHFNTSLLFSGEYLYYKVYSFNTNLKTVSKISNIAYVELVGENNKTIFKHKIRINSGTGFGDFFISTKIPSGNYKLIAYTQWMRNEGVYVFFQNNIIIVNPFENNEHFIEKGIVNKEYKEINQTKRNEIKGEIIIKVNKQEFTNRDKVKLSIKNSNNKLSNGSYSISVRKIDTVLIPDKITAEIFSNQIQDKESKHLINKGTFFLPELRGEIISGEVFSESNNRASKIKVALSIPGEKYIFKISNTNKLGKFYFNINNEYENPNAIIQVMNLKRDHYKIIIDKYKSPNFDELVFGDYKITSKWKDLIKERGVSNQIENTYSSLKVDSVKLIEPKRHFYGMNKKKYLLDDYTRFPTIKETFVEVVKDVYIKQKNEKYTFHVRLFDQIIKPTNALPLVLIDGNLIQNHNELYNLSPRKIKSISIVGNEYLDGSQAFQGVILVSTFDGNFKNEISGDFIKKVELFKPQNNKIYFTQKYDDTLKLNRIPDYRNQLLWNPNINLDAKEINLTFFTSDIDGKYEICIEGFDKNSKPISLKKIITVE